MLRVLSIDGGGIRGIIPATLLTELENLAGRSAYELFDLIAGTSTGGILALGLTYPVRGGRPQPAGELLSLYVERGARRLQFTFDYHADRLISFFREAIEARSRSQP